MLANVSSIPFGTGASVICFSIAARSAIQAGVGVTEVWICCTKPPLGCISISGRAAKLGVWGDIVTKVVFAANSTLVHFERAVCSRTLDV